MDDILYEISINLQNGEYENMPDLVRKALKEGLETKKILDEGLLAGMGIIGRKFGSHEIFLPDVLLAAKAMHAGLDVLRPHLSGSDMRSKGTIVIGTIKDDLHDIGKNLVAIMLQGAGFEVIDLGKDVSPDAFVDKAIENDAFLIAVSALLTTTMSGMRSVIETLQEKHIENKIRVMVGGAPVNEVWAKEIGADAYAHDAAQAVIVAEKLLGE